MFRNVGARLWAVVARVIEPSSNTARGYKVSGSLEDIRGHIYRGIEVTVGGKIYTILGGPYTERPEGVPGVSMLEGDCTPSNVHIPTADFSVPCYPEFFRGVQQGVLLLQQYGVLYVGCTGGVGRTGMYMVAVVIALRAMEHERGLMQGGQPGWNIWAIVDEVLSDVRQAYMGEAVETEGQEIYLQEFDYLPLAAELIQFAINCNRAEVV